MSSRASKSEHTPRRRSQVLSAIACALLSIACNRPSSASQGADTQRPSDDEIAKRLLRISETALAAKAGPPTVALPWQQLGALLPDKLGKLNAKTLVEGINDSDVTKIARASRVYRSDNEEVTIEITDAINSGALVLALLVQQASISKQPPDNGVTLKATNVGQHPSIVRHEAATKTARISIAIGGRFIVDLSAIPADGPEEALRIATALPLEELTKLATPEQPEDEAVEPSAPAEAPSPPPVDIDDPDQP